MLRKTLVAAASLAVVATVTALAAPALARDQIRAVGSSTVFPFMTAVAEAFGRTTGRKTPVVESTGTGGGFRLFCAGIGDAHPDITGASRAITAAEKATCKNNGVTDVVEVKIGYDGIVLANARQAPLMQLTVAQLWQALAKEVPDAQGQLVRNPARMWSDIDRSLPAKRIEVMGPPPTSGTRDAFVELVMTPGCAANPAMRAIQQANAARYNAACNTMREDGAWIDAGENDILIVRRLQANTDAFGVFGYSFLQENADQVQGSVIGGVKPEFDTIAAGKYPVSRPLFFYVKKQHMSGVAPGIDAFLREWTEERTWGPDGYLADRGLIPLPDAERSTQRASARALTLIGM
ncbi:MAG: phosphate ABC transporter substrate-binding protein [Alphaproteobacteria bacterium]|nr:phosphate ABC transporter substrate-binding protein [Alphaproteobacteria bacterium]